MLLILGQSWHLSHHIFAYVHKTMVESEMPTWNIEETREDCIFPRDSLQATRPHPNRI